MSGPLQIDIQASAVAQAFTRQSAVFDQTEETNLVLHYMRARVRHHVARHMHPHSHILELNAGTGLDAAYFASFGHTVHATDIAPGMVELIQTKIQNQTNCGSIRAEQLSFLDLEKLPSATYDYVFSNSGGLNCTPDLAPVLNQVKRILKPGGRLTWVIMPPICPWEMISVLKGHTKKAFRRFNKNGALSNVEGVTFRTWYHSPMTIIKKAGPEFVKIDQEGLCSLVPPPHMQQFPVRYPRLFRSVSRVEPALARMPVFRSWADHFILTLGLKT